MKHLLDIFLPRRCAHCKDLISEQYFCEVCLLDIQYAENLPSHPSSALVDYDGLIRELILRAKFLPDPTLGTLLSSYFGKSLFDSPSLAAILSHSYDCVTYIPSHKSKLIYRGYELTNLLAKQVARHLRVPVGHLLRATRNDPPLSRASSIIQRQKMVEGRFALSNPQLHCMDILLIDDIVTTGATISEAKKTLESCGHRVTAIAFSKTKHN